MKKNKANARFLTLVILLTITVILSQKEIAKANDEVNHGDEIELEIDKKTGIATPESIMERYLDKVEFLNESASFEEYCHIYWDSKVFKDTFLNDGHTREEWDNMTHLEKYNYSELVTKPERNNHVKDEEEFISYLRDDAMEFLDYVEDGEIVCEALEEVWKWQYQYNMIYGTTYNFYTMEKGNDNKEEELSQEDISELNQLKKEIDNENKPNDSNSNVLISFMKEYTLTFILVLVACIIGIVVYFKKKDKL